MEKPGKRPSLKTCDFVLLSKRFELSFLFACFFSFFVCVGLIYSPFFLFSPSLSRNIRIFLRTRAVLLPLSLPPGTTISSFFSPFF